MKFAHIADIHIGGWKEEKLNIMSTLALDKAIDKCISEHVAFVIIAGDLFNTALPNIDLIKEVSKTLNKLKEHEIECYIIPGSHDFSPSGKTMVDVFENSGLVSNVMKTERTEDSLRLRLTTDKTGAKLTGLYGKAMGLEKLDYDILDHLGNPYRLVSYNLVFQYPEIVYSIYYLIKMGHARIFHGIYRVQEYMTGCFLHLILYIYF